MLRAGSFDRRITIVSYTETVDSLGDEKRVPADLMTVWASEQTVGASERIRNPQISGEVEKVWTIRHPGVSLNSSMRVRDSGSRLYEITGITELPGRRQGFEIMARGLDKLQATVA